MRGTIIHYTNADGKGLLAAEGKQYPFEIAQWRSESAPALNALVEFAVEHDRPIAIRRLSRWALGWAALLRLLHLSSDPS